MITLRGTEGDNRDLGFAKAVVSTFGFLAEYGFASVTANHFNAYYASDCARIAVRHDRLSYELSVELARVDHSEELARPYSMQDLIRVADPERARQYRDYAATSFDAIVRGLRQLAGDLRTFGDRALRCDAEAFAALARERNKEIERFVHETQRATEGPEAQAAFARRDWGQVIELYERRADSLSRSEQKKLEIARRRATEE